MDGRGSLRRTFSSLRIWNFRLYFIGQAISLSGTWMQTIGQSWLVLQISGSGTALGFITALQFLPILVLGPLGGVVADRFSKRTILYSTQSAAGALALMLGVLVSTGSVRLWMVGILAVCLGLVNTVDNPSRQTFVIEMVGKEQLQNAVSLNSVLVNLARVIGPAVAGALIASVGLAWCFYVNAASYIAVLIGLGMMDARELHPAPLVARGRGQLREAFRYVSTTPVLRNTLLMMAIIGTLSYEFQVVLPLFAQFTLGGGAGTYASLTVAMGLGSVVGGLYTASRRTIVPDMVVRAAFMFGVVILVAAMAPNLAFAMAALVLVGVFSINFLSLGNTTLQLESLPEMRGRVMALWTVAFLGSTPIGGPIIGWIGEYLGPRWGLGVGGVAALAAGTLGFRNLRRERPVAVPEAVEMDARRAADRDTRIL
jgi:MFS family permease